MFGKDPAGKNRIDQKPSPPQLSKQFKRLDKRSGDCHWSAGTAGVVTAILLLGGVLPRIIIRRAPERIAAAILPLFEVLILPLRPFLYVIHIAGEHLRMARAGQQGMTEDELMHALIEGEKSGIVESKERTMVEGVFYLGDRPLGTFMTHRSEIQWLDIKDSQPDIREKALEHREQRCFPVADGTLDAIIGAAYLEDISSILPPARLQDCGVS